MNQEIHEIRKMLVLSTAHVPPQFREGSVPGVVLYGQEYGFLMWVPDEPIESSEGGAVPTQDDFLNIQTYARLLDCDYVMFDCDGPEQADLPTFEDGE